MRSSVLDGIIERARVEPDHRAAQDLDRELTYAQLIDEASRVAAGMRARGVGESDRVALFLPNSVDFVVAALAALWVGAVFVPLAVTDPRSRLAAIVADCTPRLIVTSSSDPDPSAFSVGGVPTAPLHLLRESEAIAQTGGDAGSRVAYMIYTSGTTGTPKGVQISNEAFAAAIQSTTRALGLSRATTTLCVSPFHFDGSYANLFPTLISGGTVIIRPRDALLFPRTFFSAVTSEKVTYSGFTPSYLRLLLASSQFSSLQNSSLEVIALGGEAIGASDLKTVWTLVPNLRVFNRYGPTETTIAVTDAELTPESIAAGTVVIGQPHPGVTFVLVDGQDHAIDGVNETGELYVGGVQLMTGYWGEPDLTNSVMRRDIVTGQTLYRTGDLAYRNEDGNYVYVDRIDRVVKRSGVRVSLVELSESLNKLSEVTAAACVAFEGEGGLGIVAFVVPTGDVSLLEVRRSASQLIPDNMLPDRIEFVTTLPLNKSNQVDESRLLSDAGLARYTPPTIR